MNKLVFGVGVNDLDYKVHVQEYVTKDGGKKGNRTKKATARRQRLQNTVRNKGACY